MEKDVDEYRSRAVEEEGGGGWKKKYAIEVSK